MSQASTCRVAVVGAGNMAREHLRAFAAVSGVELVGIHSRTRSKAEALAQEFSIPSVCDSVAALHEQSDADLVVVTVSVAAVHPVALECFEHPWTILLEKPAGLNVEEAEELASTAQARDRTVFVALNRRTYSSTLAVLSELDAQSEPRYIKVSDQQSQAAAAAGGHPQAVVDGWMYANSIHLVDLIRTFGRGKVVNVEQVIPFDADRPGVVLAKVVFDSGDVGIYEGIWHGPGPWAAVVTTSQVRWEMRPLEQAACQRRGERSLVPVEISPRDTELKAGFFLQAERAVQGALGGGAVLPTLAESLDTMRLVRAIFGR